MRNITIFKLCILLVLSALTFSCNRFDEEADVLSQEEISNIILNIKNEETGVTNIYNYMLNASADPVIQLEDGATYIVEVVFLNGNEDETPSIVEAKDEHFLLFNFQNSDVVLERIDNEASTRSDSYKLGLKTRWTVRKAQAGGNSQMVLTLIHDAAVVSDEHAGSTYGSVTGGETDAKATYAISN